MINKISRSIQGAFYVLAGLNHFIDPNFYLDLIPPALGDPEFINYLSGAIEIALGAGLFAVGIRRYAAFGLVAMLLAFIPSHLYFIQMGSCVEELCVAEWIGWARLIVIHPLLVLWAYSARN